MEKLRTIYRLRILRGGLLLSLLSILWGIGLFSVLKIFPEAMSSHLKTLICDANNITTEAQMDSVYRKFSMAYGDFYSAATNAVLFGVMSVMFLLLIIRLNGNNSFRKTIAWLMGSGVFLYSAAEYFHAISFVNSTNLNVDYNTGEWILIPGLVLLFLGVLLCVIKIVKDITESRGVD
jgi:hypothetical protein